MPELISVIIPVFNRAKYISGCIDSILNQIYKDLEIIVIDDGSTDNLKEVLVPYKDKIRYYYKENGGAASARNLGIKHARGEYIAWLDSDDRWLPFKLELQIKVLNRLKNVSFIYSDFNCFTDESGKIANSYIKEYCFTYKVCKLDFNDMFSSNTTLGELGITINGIDPKTKVYWGDLSKTILLGSLFLTSTVVNSNDCLKSVGNFDETFLTGEDYDLHVRIARRFNVGYIDFSTTEYRRFHSDQLSSEKMELETSYAVLKIINKAIKDDRFNYEKNKKFFDRRLSASYYTIGSIYYKKRIYAKALNNFLKSLRLSFKQKRIYVYTIMSLLKLPYEIARNRLKLKC